MVPTHPLKQAPRGGRRPTGLALVLTLALAAALAGTAAAHPFHASYAELSWSEDGERLEIALRVIPEDLETALSQRAGRRVLLDPGAPPVALIEAYLDERFRLRDGAGRHYAAAFLGLEVAYDETWLYFTVPARRSASPFTLDNSLLFEIAAGQSNRVRRLWAPEAPLLVYTAREPSRPLPVHE